MAYELIDKELNLWSCSISDLTREQVNEFLKQWDDELGIETLTVFYSKDTGRIVINHDNADYDIYLILCTTYLLVDSEKGEKLFSEIDNEDLRSVMKILNEALERKIENMEFKPSNIMKIIGYQAKKTYFQILHSQDFNTVFREYPGCLSKDVAADMYFAGYVNGIRAERLKRKAGAAYGRN